MLSHYDTVYPVSEVFDSIQGEGVYSGTRMTFIRLSGCSVGKPFTPEARTTLELPIYREMCRDWQGCGFACDTDYRVKQRLTVRQIVDLPEVKEARRICITGGEPLIHDLWPLLSVFNTQGSLKVHMETSGTVVPIPFGVWVTVSPKFGCKVEALERANEIKVLVGAEFDEEQFAYKFAKWFPLQKVFVQPVNDEHAINQENLNRCIQLTSKYNVRLSLQLHKILGVR